MTTQDMIGTAAFYLNSARIDLGEAQIHPASPTMAIPWIVACIQAVGRARGFLSASESETVDRELRELDAILDAATELLNSLAGCPGGVLPLSV